VALAVVLLDLLGVISVLSDSDTPTPVLSIYTPYQFSTFVGNPPGSVNGLGSAARFDGPIGTVVDHMATIYVADTNNNTIRKITPDGFVSPFAGLAGAEGTLDGTGSDARFL
jgi:hypothetical protein